MAALGVVATQGSAGCAATGAARDTVPQSGDRVVDERAPSPNGSYEHVARRALAVVALAEARGIDAAVARDAVEHLADALDACVTEHNRDGAVASGAARVIARIDEAGAVSATQIRADPGAGVVQDAALCLVVPLKRLGFGAARDANRGLAIEALWGRIP